MCYKCLAHWESQVSDCVTISGKVLVGNGQKEAIARCVAQAIKLKRRGGNY